MDPRIRLAFDTTNGTESFQRFRATVRISGASPEVILAENVLIDSGSPGARAEANITLNGALMDLSPGATTPLAIHVTVDGAIRMGCTSGAFGSLTISSLT